MDCGRWRVTYKCADAGWRLVGGVEMAADPEGLEPGLGRRTPPLHSTLSSHNLGQKPLGSDVFLKGHVCTPSLYGVRQLALLNRERPRLEQLLLGWG